jgi:hypothetical protein
VKLTANVHLNFEEDEPNLVAANALERLARQLRLEAPHDFVTGGVNHPDYAADYRWEASACPL